MAATASGIRTRGYSSETGGIRWRNRVERVFHVFSTRQKSEHMRFPGSREETSTSIMSRELLCTAVLLRLDKNVRPRQHPPGGGNRVESKTSYSRRRTTNGRLGWCSNVFLLTNVLTFAIPTRQIFSRAKT